jgi:hypothetical protein
MRKARLYLIAFIAALIYLASANKWFMDLLVNKWNNEKRPAALQWDKYKYGDLYGLSYLKDFRTPCGEKKYECAGTFPVDSTTADLWIIGDSYLQFAFSENDSVSCLEKVKFIQFYKYNQDFKGSIALKFKPGRKKILLVEMNERYVKDNLCSPKMRNKIMSCYVTPAELMQKKTSAKDKPLSEIKIIPKNVEQNLETILFGYEMFRPIKESKAQLNYLLFGRTGPEVFASKETGMLYLSETVDTTEERSSFRPLSKADELTIVNAINMIRQEYLSRGFDEVYFTFIPNSSTIIPPLDLPYNQLIPRIQANRSVKAPLIDIYTKMKAYPKPAELFWRSDTHWNSKGFGLWIGEFNKRVSDK